MTDTFNETDLCFKSAIEIVINWKKSIPEGPELLKAVCNLSVASKTFNELFDDKIIISSCRSVQGGGSQFARAKLYEYISTSNIYKFIACADQILQNYHRSIFLHIFTKCLIAIVKNSSYQFLTSYMTFLTSRGVVVQSEHFYLRDKGAGGKYPGFNPMNLVKALRIANENGWSDKALLLFHHLVKYHSTDKVITIMERTSEIKERISKNIKLNFDGQLGLHIKQRWKNSIRWRLGGVPKHLFNTLLAPKRIELSKVPKVVFDLPIEQQPWFFGYVKNKRELLEDCSANESFIVSFLGSKLQLYTKPNYWNPQNFDSHNPIRSTRARFYLPNGGKVEYFYVYQFYRAIVEQDLNALKSIHQTYDIKAETLQQLSQPNPFLELLANVPAPKDEIVQYLIDINMSRDLMPWPYKLAMNDEKIAIIEKLLMAGAKIGTEAIIQLMQQRSFMNEKSFERLISAWELASGAYKLMHFIMDKFQQEYKKHHLFSERLLTVLWIYKYGQSSDGYNHMQKLPKELIKLIIEFIDEPPLFYLLARRIMKIPKISGARPISVYDIHQSPLYGTLVLESNSDLLVNFINYASGVQCKVIRKNYSWIRRAICEREKLSLILQRLNLAKYMLKYETDITIFRHLHRHDITMGDWPFVYAIKTKNRAALRYFIKERNNFVMPSRDEFEAKVKRPKYNVTYEEALQLIEQFNSEAESTVCDK